MVHKKIGLQEKILRLLVLIACVLTGFITTAYAGGTPVRAVNSHAFLVSVKPVDKESYDAKNADLYITRFPRSGWVMEGECKKIDKNGQLMFSKEVEVPSDGVYYFTSRAGDIVGKTPPPLKGAPAQVKVISDTILPELRLIAPVPGRILRAGELLRIEWDAVDRNIAEHPVSLAYTYNDGKKWIKIADRQPNTGHFQWKVPSYGGKHLKFRVTCKDIAGNIGQVVSESSYKIMDEAPEREKFRPVLPVDIKLTPKPEKTLLGGEVVMVSSATPGSASVADKFAPELKDPRPVTKFPELDANNTKLPDVEKKIGQSAYIAYIMAGNLVRQGRYKDSLRYYRTAVDADSNFDEAWNDMALVYKQIGAFAKADSCIVRALSIEPKSPRYLNTRGSIYQASGFEILQDPASGNESLARANDLILFAVKTYGEAVSAAQRIGRLSDCAETYFHLGEICYFANQDPTGAKQYWLKVLDLHTPTPDLDNVMLDKNSPEESLTRSIYEKNTEMWVSLQTWQMWARSYIQQLNQLERGVAAPRPPFTTGAFVRNNQRQLTAQAQIQSAQPQAHALNPQGQYYGTPYYIGTNGKPTVAPSEHIVLPMKSDKRVDRQKYIVETGEYSETVIREQTWVDSNEKKLEQAYGQQSAFNQQNDMIERGLPPQGAWSKGSYGSTPGY